MSTKIMEKHISNIFILEEIYYEIDLEFVFVLFCFALFEW